MMTTLPTEIILTVANHATAATKSKFACLSRQYNRLYRHHAYRARVGARIHINEDIKAVNPAVHHTLYVARDNPVNIKYNLLPNLRLDKQNATSASSLDGPYVEYHRFKHIFIRNGWRRHRSQRRIYGNYVNGVKHGKFTTLTSSGGVVLYAYYNYGAPCGIWKANFYGIEPPPDRAKYQNGKLIQYAEKVWYDIARRVAITWIKQDGHTILGPRITRNINLLDVYERLYPHRITAYESRQSRRTV